MRNLKKWHQSTVFLSEWTFFWQNMDFTAVSFLENGRFFTKYGHENGVLCVKNRKRRASYRLFWPIILCSFDRIYVFWSIMGIRGFFMKSFKKMKWEHCVFERWTFFRQNMGHESSVSTENGRLFWKNMSIKAVIFREKAENKGILLTFSTHNIL